MKRHIFSVITAVLLLLPMCACSSRVDIELTTSLTAVTKDVKISESLVLGFNGDGNPKTLSRYDLDIIFDYDEIHSLTVANYAGSDLEILGQINGLNELKLMRMKRVNDISFLSKLSELSSLMIYDLADDFRDISVISDLDSLQKLSINNISVEDFSPLCSLKNLRILDLTSTAIPPEQYDMLKRALPKCEIINVTFLG